MFTGAELCTRLPPGRDPEGGLREDQASHVGTGEPPTPQTFLAHPCPVPMVMLLGWGTVLLSKVFSRAATPNSFRSRSSKADSRDRERSVGSQETRPWLQTS